MVYASICLIIFIFLVDIYIIESLDYQFLYIYGNFASVWMAWNGMLQWIYVSENNFH